MSRSLKKRWTRAKRKLTTSFLLHNIKQWVSLSPAAEADSVFTVIWAAAGKEGHAAHKHRVYLRAVLRRTGSEIHCDSCGRATGLKSVTVKRSGPFCKYTYRITSQDHSVKFLLPHDWPFESFLFLRPTLCLSKLCFYHTAQWAVYGTISKELTWSCLEKLKVLWRACKLVNVAIVYL